MEDVMGEQPRVEVRSLRKWLLKVKTSLSRDEWALLLLSYFDDFPYGKLERMGDPSELYNQLASGQVFSATESFQLLLNRLALLKEDGRACIDLLRDPEYHLSLPETCPDLNQKLSRRSQLMEAIVAALVELTPRQLDRLMKHLGTTWLRWHRDHCELFRVVSQLRFQLIITVENTEAFVNGLKHVQAPQSAIDRLWVYHGTYGLDLRCFDHWQRGTSPCALSATDPRDTPRCSSAPPGQRHCVTTLSMEGSPTEDLSVSRHIQRWTSNPRLTSVGESTPLLQPRETPPKVKQWRRRLIKCGIVGSVIAVAAVIAAVLAVVIPYFAVYDPQQSVTAYGNNKQTILLGNVTGLLVESFTISQTNTAYNTTYYRIPTSGLDKEAELSQELVYNYTDTNHSVLPVGQFGDLGPSGVYYPNLQKPSNPVYFSPGDVMAYSLCLSTTPSDYPMFAFMVAFDQEDVYFNFHSHTNKDCHNVNSTSAAVWQYTLPVGRNMTKCVQFNFTAPRYGYYYFSGVICNSTVHDKDQVESFSCNMTRIYRTFNFSNQAFTELCHSTGSSKLCSRGLEFGTSLYSILASVDTSSTENSDIISYRLSFEFRWYAVGILVAALAAIAIVIIILSSLCILFGCCNRK